MFYLLLLEPLRRIFTFNFSTSYFIIIHKHIPKPEKFKYLVKS